MNIGIIITGIVYDYCIDELIESYANCDYIKIISTWNYIDHTIVSKLRTHNFLVIQTDFDDKICKKSVNYQSYSYMIGMEFAKQLNITHILRMRGDMKCSNINKLLNIYQCIYEENKLIFLININHDGGYLIDYAFFGSVELMNKYANIFQNENDNRFPERFRQEVCYGTNDPVVINNQVIYSAEHLLNENIDFAFLKDIYKKQKALLLGYYTHNQNNKLV